MFQSGRICEKMHQVYIKCLRNRKEGLRKGDGERGVYQSPIACQHKKSKKNQVRIRSTNVKDLKGPKHEQVGYEFFYIKQTPMVR
jgi:hypothetical protein